VEGIQRWASDAIGYLSLFVIVTASTGASPKRWPARVFEEIRQRRIPLGRLAGVTVEKKSKMDPEEKSERLKIPKVVERSAEGIRVVQNIGQPSFVPSPPTPFYRTPIPRPVLEPNSNSPRLKSTYTAQGG